MPRLDTIINNGLVFDVSPRIVNRNDGLAFHNGTFADDLGTRENEAWVELILAARAETRP